VPGDGVVPHKWPVRSFIEQRWVPCEEDETADDITVVDAPDWDWPQIFNEAQNNTVRFQLWWRSVIRLGQQWWRWRRAVVPENPPERRYAQVPDDCNALRDPGFDQYKDTIFLTLAQAIVARRHLAARRADEHPIGAVLVGSSGAILSWSVNGNSEHDKSLHAEANCLRRYQALSGGQPIPVGSTLYTTLQPCEMCAAMIVTAAEANVDVIYAEKDPGIGKTALSIRPPEPRVGIAERRLEGGPLVRPAAAVSLAARRLVFQEAAKKHGDPHLAFLAAMDNAKEPKKVWDTSVWPPHRVKVGRMMRAEYTRDMKDKVKDASKKVEELAKGYKPRFDALKKDRDSFLRAPVDRYRTRVGMQAFLEALKMLDDKGRLEALIFQHQHRFGGLTPSKTALAQARSLLGFLSRFPDAL
jgi:tRNA(Arg) A34 adenosine deaminase TadA